MNDLPAAPPPHGRRRPEIAALITARGGSKGLPGKNIKLLAGKPMIAYSILAAQGARSVSRVVVSTDDAAIAQAARQWGAEVPFLRPAELAQDDTPHHRVLGHALDWLEDHEGYRPQYLLLLQPTSPLRTSDDIEGAVALAADKDADAVLGVRPARDHPLLARILDSEGRVSPFCRPEAQAARRQDFPPAFAVNGAIYLFKPRALRERGANYMQGAYGYVMPEERSLDVDTAWDFRLAELVFGEGR
jgi:CMP-N-acetylneuraminic acid synthetase